MTDRVLFKAARTAVSLAKPKKKESFLVVTDTKTLEIGQAIFDAAKEVSNAFLIVMTPTGRHGSEPPVIVAEAMRTADIVYCPTKFSLTHTNAAREIKKRNARGATLPGITKSVLVRGMNADYSSIKKTNARLAKAMSKAKRIRVVAQDTEFVVERGARKVITDEGAVIKGNVVNLPGGEVFFSPADFKGYFTGTHGKVKAKTFEVENNKVMHIADSALKKEVWGIKNARNIAEFAIGTNPGAEMRGVTLEDEKVLGTCHVAIGDSKSIGGNTEAAIHWDFVIKKPSIWFDETLIMKRGKLVKS
ncbi:aminopeptidase [archaeon]|nr:aminopeptidase [archaeon]